MDDTWMEGGHCHALLPSPPVSFQSPGWVITFSMLPAYASLHHPIIKGASSNSRPDSRLGTLLYGTLNFYKTAIIIIYYIHLVALGRDPTLPPFFPSSPRFKVP